MEEKDQTSGLGTSSDQSDGAGSNPGPDPVGDAPSSPDESSPIGDAPASDTPTPAAGDPTES